MYHKIKNTLAGLTFVAAFVAGGLLLSDPLPAAAAPAPAMLAADSQDVLVARAVAIVLLAAGHELAVRDDEAERAERARKLRSSRLRLELGMPYYSFGAMLPRRGES